jgi:FkbH-like protein
MKLSEALRHLHAPIPGDATPFSVYLACGITPLHLETFMRAHLRRLLPDRDVRVGKGLFGDLLGSLAAAKVESPHAAVVVVEPQDLDPRLGIRQPGSWNQDALADVAAGLRARVDLLRSRLEALAASAPVALALGTLPLPPAGRCPPWVADQVEIAFDAELDRLRAWAVTAPGVRLLSRRRLDLASPPHARLDPSADLATGCPYTLEHAEALAALLARLAAAVPPKKAIITDLDDTLWLGIVGEDGPENVKWDLDGHAQLHGLYQLVLSALSEGGTLVGVASRNDPRVVESAFARHDILLRSESIFPFQVNWGPKSSSVAEILRRWNISAADTVFIDDSPMELAEVQAAHPAIECLLFPKGDAAGALRLLETLRERCGKASVTAEDRLRQASLRQAEASAVEAGAEGMSEEFLARAGAVVTFDYRKDPADQRPLELINKTNQFNLNGRRISEVEWRRHLEDPGAVTLVVSYRDRFGPLGKIAVLVGRVDGKTFRSDAWVMSCRAFARRIEYHVLGELFDRFGVESVVLDYRETDRNGPVRDFLASLQIDPAGAAVLSQGSFQATCPAFYHAKETAA